MRPCKDGHHTIEDKLKITGTNLKRLTIKTKINYVYINTTVKHVLVKITFLRLLVLLSFEVGIVSFKS